MSLQERIRDSQNWLQCCSAADPRSQLPAHPEMHEEQEGRLTKGPTNNPQQTHSRSGKHFNSLSFDSQSCIYKPREITLE